jgi:hypothetical protein
MAQAILNHPDKQSSDAAERMYHLWDEALGRGNSDEWLTLYARDATLERPLVPYLTGKTEGVVRGHEELLPFLKKVAERKPPLRQRYRSGYFTDGRKLMWEYPRQTGDGDQMDFVEVMELNDQGLIQHHRVYWGWRGLGILQRDEYHR